MVIPEGSRNVFHLWAHKIDYVHLGDPDITKLEYFKLVKDLRFENYDMSDTSKIIAKQVLIVDKSKKRFLVAIDGEWYQIRPKQFPIEECVERLIKQKAITKISATTSKMYEFVLLFQINSGDTTAKLDALYNKYKNISIPQKYKQINGMFYRGITLKADDFKRFKAGESFKLQKRVITSWSIDKGKAAAFAGGSTGLIMKVTSKDVDIFINLSHADFDWTPYAEEKEVIVKGNGLESISMKDTVK